jgi:hypothetical protein
MDKTYVFKVGDYYRWDSESRSIVCIKEITSDRIYYIYRQGVDTGDWGSLPVDTFHKWLIPCPGYNSPLWKVLYD